MMAKTSLLPGFRFCPTDVELVCYFLKRKVMGKPFQFEAIAEVELYKFAPWDLPDKSQLRGKDLEWYFFCPRDRKYPNGSRTNHATDIGYWKATGKDRSVINNSRGVGMKGTLIFHEGNSPKGNRTNWVMYEYRLEDRELVDVGFLQDAYVLCKIFQQSGPGPKLGEQYGAPFNEEDWEVDTTTTNSFPLPSVSSSSPEPSNNQAIQLDSVSQQPVASSHIEMSSNADLLDADGIWLEELEEFLNSSPPIENSNGKMPDSAILSKNVNEASTVDPEGMYNELENLSSQSMVSGNINHSENILSETALHPMLSELDSEHYVELNDFRTIGDSNPSESIMPNDPSSLHPSAHCPNFQNLSHMPDPISYFGNDVITATWDPCYPSESIMPNDLFMQHPRARIPKFQNLSHMPDPISYFENDVIAAMWDSSGAGPDIMSEQSSLSMQILGGLCLI